MSDNLKWNPGAKQKFDTAISKMPVFHRHIADKMISAKAEDLTAKRGSLEVQEEDVARAFFADCPGAFKDLMRKILDESGIDYKKFNLE